MGDDQQKHPVVIFLCEKYIPPIKASSIPLKYCQFKFEVQQELMLERRILRTACGHLEKTKELM
jgi:hypothetical protein